MTTTIDSPLIQVKSRLRPLPAWESALEWLIERLPRRLIRVGLNPNDEVAVINECKGEYKATGSVPSFAMTLTPDAPQGGWYYLEAALTRNNGSREASIRAEVRGKIQENIVIPIPTNLRGTVREVFYLPPNVTKLHWSPTAAPGFFSQSPLLLHKISRLESVIRRVYRVIYDLFRFRNRTPSTRFGLTWWVAISNLQDAYQRTATLRIKRLLGNDYATFIALNDTLKKSDIRAMRKQIQKLPLRPVISLVMPVRAPIEEFFGAALDSVVGQIYPHWELLLAGDFSSDAQGLAIAKAYQSKNAQVKVISVEPEKDLASTLNSALEAAQGEFVARLNQHDQIPPHALFLLAQEIGMHPDADLIYTDNDSIDEANKRLDPCFKPDWNPDLFFSYNYLANLTLYRRLRALELGGYRGGFEGAEDYDLTLRYLRGLPAARIRHIPRVLSHSRVQNQSVALTPSPLWGEGGTSHQSGKRALTAYFERSGVTVEDGPAPGLYRIKYPLPEQLPLVSIIIPTRDRVEILKTCIESIQKITSYPNWELIIVDNGSDEAETLTFLEELANSGNAKIITYDSPFNYSAINNMAVESARGEIIVFMNNDVEVMSAHWLTELVSHAIRPQVGIVGSKLLYSSGVVQHAGIALDPNFIAIHLHRYLPIGESGYCHRAAVVQDISAVTGACMAMRAEVFQRCRGFEADQLQVNYSDVDLCLKALELGLNNVFTPYSLLYHHESISRGLNDSIEKVNLLRSEAVYMRRTWGGCLENDPALNINLYNERLWGLIY